MTETQWNSCADPEKMLGFLHNSGRPSQRKLRLFACECCYRIWDDLLIDGRSRDAVQVSERYADGQATEDDLENATAIAAQAMTELRPSGNDRIWAGLNLVGDRPEPFVPAACAAAATTLRDGMEAALRTQEYVEKAAIEWAMWTGASKQTAARIGAKARSAIIRDLFGPLPFRSIACPPAWRTAQVLVVARTTYDERAFERLPTLAAALEAAGCTDSEVLAHLRSRGPHVSGCWALDLILGRT